MQIKDLQSKVAQFRDERNWRQFHTPKNLAQALASEVGELNDLYLWEREPNPMFVAPEMADVLIYLLSLADVMQIDLCQAVEQKLAINAQNYPAEKFKGNCEKKNA